jgi:hypothetical protein
MKKELLSKEGQPQGHLPPPPGETLSAKDALTKLPGLKTLQWQVLSSQDATGNRFDKAH